MFYVKYSHAPCYTAHMSLHRPKLISSVAGIGLNTTKSMKYISKTLAIGTEIWNTLETPWKQDDTIIAEEGYKWVTRWGVGKPYTINKFYDNNGKLIGIYCDVARPVQPIIGGFEFYDLYLDVWQVAGQPIRVLDEEELQDALEAGYITTLEAHNAQIVAIGLVTLLEEGSKILQF